MVKALIPTSLALALLGVVTSLAAPHPHHAGSTRGSTPTVTRSGPHTSRYLGLLPTNSTFVPIAVWDQAPNGGNVPRGYKDQAQAFRAMGVNVFVGMDSWPERFGSDNGELAAAVANHMYVIGGGDPTSDTSAESVASIAALVAKTPGASKYFIGYQWGDEPLCTTDVAAQVTKIESEDPTRMAFENEGAWTAWLPRNTVGNSNCLSESEANLRATSIASADEYALSDPWHTYLCRSGSGYDCLWAYGQEATNLRALVGPNTPVWEFVESGTDDLGLSSENGGKSEEPSATPTQVNSAAWLAVLEGANGIEWFCDERLPNGNPVWDYCLSNNTIRDNLTYVDHSIERFAAELNSPSVAGASTVQSSNRSVPVVAKVKDVNGVTYLMVEGDRLGSTTATYTLDRYASGTAQLIYDSDSQYDPNVSELGKTFRLNSLGQFSDPLPSSYCVKIYEIHPL